MRTVPKFLGVSDQTIEEINEIINGNAYGFGDIKPWTKKEQDKAIKNSDKKFLNKLKKYLDHEEIDINKY
jgi:hypothetical protein